MATFQYDQFSQHPVARLIDKRLGMMGFARLVRIIEECTDSGQAAMARSDWFGALHCSPDEFDELLAVLDQAEAFKASQADGEYALLMLSMGPRLSPLLAKPDPSTVIHTDPAQWAEWMRVELAAPNWLLTDPASVELFRRWCATNVSLAEIQAAAERAAQSHDMKPVGLHEQLKKIRAERIAQAHNRA